MRETRKKEKCWEIVEQRPIKVKVDTSWTGRYYTITVDPMLMSYDTFNKVRSNLPKENLKYGQERGYPYTEDDIKYANDIFGTSYDYHNGEAVFTSDTLEDIDVWLERFSHIVIK